MFSCKIIIFLWTVFTILVSGSDIVEDKRANETTDKLANVVNITKFREQNLLCHNRYRINHGVNPLTQSVDLDKISQDYAEWLAYEDKGIVHSSNPYGENLYQSYGRTDNGTNACNFWYDEITLYNFDLDQPNNLKEVGHFTQMVWKGACSVGMGVATSKSGVIYVVATYDPKGNSENEFRRNVFPPGAIAPSKESLSPFDFLFYNDIVCSKPDDQTILQQNLECQNIIRSRHCAEQLKYKDVMNEYAQKHAEWIASNDSLIFGNSPYLEFLQYYSGRNINGYNMCRDMYQDVLNYNFTSHAPVSSSESYQRFSSMVWKSTVYTGIGMAESSTGKTYVVIVYEQPTSTLGEYSKNVQPSSCNKLAANSVHVTPSIKPSQNNLSNDVTPDKPKFNPTLNSVNGESDLNKLRQENLECHNYYRSHHGVEPLKYSEKINKEAQNRAQLLADADKGYYIFENVPYSQIILATNISGIDGSFACREWYNESRNYSYGLEPLSDDGDYKSNFSAFTSMIWKNSQFTGFGLAKSVKGITYIVSFYDPIGNIKGQYIENIPPPNLQNGPGDTSTHLDVTTDKNVFNLPETNLYVTGVEPNKVISYEEFTGNVNNKPDESSPSNIEIIELSQQNLNCQNSFRSLHGSKLLVYKSELIRRAQRYADMIAEQNGPLVKMNPSMLGVNIFTSTAKNIDGYSACYQWYSEFNKYQYSIDDPSNLREVGNFTQMIWKNSTYTGIGVATSKTGSTFIVATYYPLGNIKHKFSQNVGRPQPFHDEGFSILDVLKGKEMLMNITVSGSVVLL